MIAQVLAAVAGRAEGADATRKTDDTLAVTLDDGDAVAISHQHEEQVFLRVLVEGRVGRAEAGTNDTTALATAALNSAAHGPELPLLFPGWSPLPTVTVNYPRAAAAQSDDLTRLGRALTERLRADGRRIQVSVERSSGAVAVGNSRGVEARYQVSCIAVDVAVEFDADSMRRVRAGWTGADLPDEAVLTDLAAQLETQIRWSAKPVTVVRPPRVLLLPEALAVLLSPLRQVLAGESALTRVAGGQDQVGEPWLSPLFTFWDDPLMDGRPASRPIDDECVPCWRQPLVKEGRRQRTLVDLETGALAGVPATGHARRTIGGRPRAGWSNIVMDAGAGSDADLLARAGEGLVVGVLSGGPLARGGTFSLPIGLGWGISAGEITGRIDSAILAGNSFDMLRQIVAVGSERRWVGSQYLPSVLVDGLRFATRRAA